jgi:hypothetical protein
VYSSTVKGISVKLLHVISHKGGLEQLCGDVSLAFVNAYTKELVYAIAGPEFGEHCGKTVVIRKALYGLSSSAERWHSHFADTLRSLGFKQTRFDNDVWLKLNKNESSSYDYICTHIDDFCICSKESGVIMKQIEKVYTVKSIGPPDYYLGNDYIKDKKGRWCIGCKKYLKEAIKRVEGMFGTLKKYSNPSETGDHPELDTSEVLIAILNGIFFCTYCTCCTREPPMLNFILNEKFLHTDCTRNPK